MPVEPKKPMLKTHDNNRLTLTCDALASSFAFNVNVRRYHELPGMLYVTFGVTPYNER
jgi:hypothetical protein